MKIEIKLFLLFALISSCNIDEGFNLQGHRGYRGLYPENSIEGFLKSIEIGVNTLEIDVVISHDKQVVISHEPWISSHICIDSAGNKINNDKEKFNMYKMDYVTIRKFDCGIIGNKQFPEQNKISTFKPTLINTINIVEDLMNVEIKKKLIKYNRVGDHIWYISDMKRFKKDYPKWKQKYSIKKIIKELIENLS